MALTRNERQAIVEYLTSNCDCWSAEGDVDVLNGFDDDKLVQLQESSQRQIAAEAVANAAATGFEDVNGIAYRLNPETGQWETRSPAQNKMMSAKKMAKKMAKEMKEDDEEEEDDDEEEYAMRRKTNNERRAQTIEELLRHASPALRDQVDNRLRTSQALEDREKDKIIGKLLANVADVERPARREWLQNRPLDELEQMLAFVPKSLDAEEVANSSRNTPGPWPGSNLTGLSPMDDDDVLPLPGDPWKPVTNDSTVESSKPTIPNNASIQDYLRSAPPEVQSVLRNAMAIDGQKRSELIARLTENVMDDEESERLAKALRGKPVHELEILVNALAPSSGTRGGGRAGVRPSGVYAPSPPLLNSRGSSGDDDDVLPPPSWDWSTRPNTDTPSRRRAQ